MNRPGSNPCLCVLSVFDYTVSMRLHRFFLKEAIQGKSKILLTEESLIHQWKKVFRLAAGDSVILFDGSGSEYVCDIILLTKELAELQIKEKKELKSPNSNNASKKLWLFASIIKKDNFEWIVEKATELGAHAIVPVLATRSEKKDLNQERLLKISVEASEQSGRGDVPEIYEPVSLQDAFALLKEQEKTTGEEIRAVAFDPSGTSFSEEMRVPRSPYSGEVGALFIGPEGGFTEEELSLFKENNVKIRSLGSQILRAETAAVAVSALFLIN
jgi:16S rRNA (uracil1498-N3)-methyltransferase